MEKYRSGHNEPHSKCGHRVTGAWVRIPSSPLGCGVLFLQLEPRKETFLPLPWQPEILKAGYELPGRRTSQNYVSDRSRTYKKVYLK